MSPKPLKKSAHPDRSFPGHDNAHIGLPSVRDMKGMLPISIISPKHSVPPPPFAVSRSVQERPLLDLDRNLPASVRRILADMQPDVSPLPSAPFRLVHPKRPLSGGDDRGAKRYKVQRPSLPFSYAPAVPVTRAAKLNATAALTDGRPLAARASQGVEVDLEAEATCQHASLDAKATGTDDVLCGASASLSSAPAPGASAASPASSSSTQALGPLKPPAFRKPGSTITAPSISGIGNEFDAVNGVFNIGLNAMQQPTAGPRTRRSLEAPTKTWTGKRHRHVNDDDDDDEDAAPGQSALSAGDCVAVGDDGTDAAPPVEPTQPRALPEGPARAVPARPDRQAEGCGKRRRVSSTEGTSSTSRTLVPQPAPEPKTERAAALETEPTPSPTPEPKPVPAPEPNESKPQPVPEPEPQPEPAPSLVPKPEHQPDSEPEPTPDAASGCKGVLGRAASARGGVECQGHGSADAEPRANVEATATAPPGVPSKATPQSADREVSNAFPAPSPLPPAPALTLTPGESPCLTSTSAPRPASDRDDSQFTGLTAEEAAGDQPLPIVKRANEIDPFCGNQTIQAAGPPKPIPSTPQPPTATSFASQTSDPGTAFGIHQTAPGDSRNPPDSAPATAGSPAPVTTSDIFPGGKSSAALPLGFGICTGTGTAPGPTASTAPFVFGTAPGPTASTAPFVFGTAPGPTASTAPFVFGSSSSSSSLSSNGSGVAPLPRVPRRRPRFSGPPLGFPAAPFPQPAPQHTMTAGPSPSFASSLTPCPTRDPAPASQTSNSFAGTSVASAPTTTTATKTTTTTTTTTLRDGCTAPFMSGSSSSGAFAGAFSTAMTPGVCGPPSSGMQSFRAPVSSAKPSGPPDDDAMDVDEEGSMGVQAAAVGRFGYPSAGGTGNGVLAAFAGSSHPPAAGTGNRMSTVFAGSGHPSAGGTANRMSAAFAGSGHPPATGTGNSTSAAFAGSGHPSAGGTGNRMLAAFAGSSHPSAGGTGNSTSAAFAGSGHPSAGGTANRMSAAFAGSGHPPATGTGNSTSAAFAGSGHPSAGGTGNRMLAAFAGSSHPSAGGTGNSTSAAFAGSGHPSAGGTGNRMLAAFAGSSHPSAGGTGNSTSAAFAGSSHPSAGGTANRMLAAFAGSSHPSAGGTGNSTSAAFAGSSHPSAGGTGNRMLAAFAGSGHPSAGGTGNGLSAVRVSGTSDVGGSGPGGFGGLSSVPQWPPRVDPFAWDGGAAGRAAEPGGSGAFVISCNPNGQSKGRVKRNYQVKRKFSSA